MPDFHNPTGLLIDEASRRRALRALARAGTHAVIDETFVELNLDAVPRCRRRRPRFGDARTITVGSLSKAVWGGLRVGWARADPALIHRLVDRPRRQRPGEPAVRADSSPRTPSRASTRSCVERRDDDPPRRAALADALDAHLPEWRYALPAGGLFLWAELPGPISTSLALEAARATTCSSRRAPVSPPPACSSATSGSRSRSLRAQLERAVQILAEVTPRESREDISAPRLPAYVA